MEIRYRFFLWHILYLDLYVSPTLLAHFYPKEEILFMVKHDPGSLRLPLGSAHSPRRARVGTRARASGSARPHPHFPDFIFCKHPELSQPPPP